MKQYYNSYDTLSYAWEDPEAACALTLSIMDKVYVKGMKLNVDSKRVAKGTLQIRLNLHALLRQLRRNRYSRFIWIDAICIDQGNLTEKSAQIPLMRHIFKEAKNVFVWLGEATDLEEGALSIIPALTRY